MGTTSPRGDIAGALFTPVQQRVLALLYGQPERRFQSAELIRLAEGGTGAVHRILGRLESSGLIEATRIGNQKHYQANRSSPIFAELHGLVVKTIGIAEPLRKALSPIAERIHAAFVYGSVAKGQARANSDVDVMVLSDKIDYADVYEALHPAERSLARTVNPTLMSTSEWRSKRARGGSFVARVMEQPKLYLIGGDDELR